MTWLRHHFYLTSVLSFKYTKMRAYPAWAARKPREAIKVSYKSSD